MKPTSKLSDQTTKVFKKRYYFLPILIQQAMVSINLLDNIRGSYDLFAVSGGASPIDSLYRQCWFFGGYVAPGIFVSQHMGQTILKEQKQSASKFGRVFALAVTVLLVFDSFIRQFFRTPATPPHGYFPTANLPDADGYQLGSR